MKVERLHILRQIDVVEDGFCGACTLRSRDKDGKVIGSPTVNDCRKSGCPHIETLLSLGEQLLELTHIERAHRYGKFEKKIERGQVKRSVFDTQAPEQAKQIQTHSPKPKKIESEVTEMAKEPKWKQVGLTLKKYNELHDGLRKSDRQIADEFGINENDVQAFKRAHDLIKKRADWKNYEQNAPVTTTDAEPKEPVVKLKPEFASPQTQAEKELEALMEKVAHYKNLATTTAENAAKQLEEKDARIKELEARETELEQQLGSPAITHDDAALWQKQRAELETERDALADKLRYVRAERNDLKTTLDNAERENKILRSELVELRARVQVKAESDSDATVVEPENETVHPYVELYNSALAEKEQLEEQLADLQERYNEMLIYRSSDETFENLLMEKLMQERYMKQLNQKEHTA